MRLLLTGLGLTSALGDGAAYVFERLCSGDCALAPVTLFDTSAQRCTLGAQLRHLKPEYLVPFGEAWRWSRTDAMALLAAREALLQAHLNPRQIPTALILAGSTAGMFEGEPLLASFCRDPALLAPDPRLVCHPLSSTADRLREALGLGPTRTLCCACAGGSTAILLGALWLRLGRVERVLVGASEGLCRLTFAGFNALSITDPEGCRPFDRRRRGINLGEGAAFLVLETEASARARGASPLAELAGWASGAEATHIIQPEEDGSTILSLLQSALTQAGLTPGEIDWISAHGTGTPRNDLAEATALQRFFGNPGPLVSSHKGQLGHTLSSAGAVGAVLAALAIQQGRVPPTGGLQEPDEACRIRLTTNLSGATKGEVRAAVVNAFGFGGLDTILVLRAAGYGENPSAQEPPPVVLTEALEFRPREGEGQIRWEEVSPLEESKARRFQRAERVVTGAMVAVLRGGRAGRVGVAVGSAFGGVTSCMELLARIEAAGGRCTAPLLFPGQVPSSPAASAAIYAGLRGPVVATADLGLSGEMALFTAVELVAAGEADGMVVVAFAEGSRLVGEVFDPLFLGTPRGAAEEGAVAFLVESGLIAQKRGARVLARVLAHEHGTGIPRRLGVPEEGDRVLVAGLREEYVALIEALGWAGAPVQRSSRAGSSEVAGAQAAAEAAHQVAEEGGRRLVVGRGPGRWSALLLGPAQS
ncbi:MAG: beta-ketoacyl synthase N-terminal-like domain-containing protein [Myxococcales bacterium]|nr:3-oxoacyl-ACP synthase [Polyangiaceae bacterium]MDW8248148.1 beta-ketoacyl synthase N-terminal-like domain-containing protein [Myxococcales bacterium]